MTKKAYNSPIAYFYKLKSHNYMLEGSPEADTPNGGSRKSKESSFSFDDDDINEEW